MLDLFNWPFPSFLEHRLQASQPDNRFADYAAFVSLSSLLID